MRRLFAVAQDLTGNLAPMPDFARTFRGSACTHLACLTNTNRSCRSARSGW